MVDLSQFWTSPSTFSASRIEPRTKRKRGCPEGRMFSRLPVDRSSRQTISWPASSRPRRDGADKPGAAVIRILACASPRHRPGDGSFIIMKTGSFLKRRSGPAGSGAEESYEMRSGVSMIRIRPWTCAAIASGCRGDSAIPTDLAFAFIVLQIRIVGESRRATSKASMACRMEWPEGSGPGYFDGPQPRNLFQSLARRHNQRLAGAISTSSTGLNALSPWPEIASVILTTAGSVRIDPASCSRIRSGSVIVTGDAAPGISEAAPALELSLAS